MSLVISDEDAEKIFVIRRFMSNFIDKAKTPLYEKALKRMLVVIGEILDKAEVKFDG